jgi:hypothetical protein
MHKDAETPGCTQGRPGGGGIAARNRVEGGAVIRFCWPAAKVTA